MGALNWPDHSRGHTPARAGDHLDHSKNLYHNRCGTPIYLNGYGWTCFGACNVGYSLDVMSRFNDDAMATRFHVRSRREDHETTYAIVWKSDPVTKKAYTTLVPKEEAHKYERFDYYDRK